MPLHNYSLFIIRYSLSIDPDPDSDPDSDASDREGQASAFPDEQQSAQNYADNICGGVIDVTVFAELTDIDHIVPQCHYAGFPFAARQNLP